MQSLVDAPVKYLPFSVKMIKFKIKLLAPSQAAKICLSQKLFFLPQTFIEINLI